MKICVDARIISQYARQGYVSSEGAFTGIPAYIINVLSYLSSIATEDKFVAFTQTNSEPWLDLFSARRNICFKQPAGMQIGLWWKSLGVSLASQNEAADLLFIPTPRVPFYSSIPIVTVLHDLGFLFQGDYQPAGTYRKVSIGTNLALQRSTRVITVSQEVRREALEHYRIPPEKVVAVHCGLDKLQFNNRAESDEKTNAVLQRYKLRKPYLLHVGVIQGRKNLTRLINAYHRLAECRMHADHQLVLAGKVGWKYETVLEAAAKRVSGGAVVMTGPVRQEDLPALYKNATAVVIPSLYEGFCLPAVEAMACGVPLALSNLRVLREVAGDAAIFFDPYEEEEIGAVIGRVIADSELRRKLSCEGERQSRSYSWEKCANDILGVFREALSGIVDRPLVSTSSP